MATNIAPAQNSYYKEDVAVAGESLVAGACVIYDITFVNDSAAAIVVIVFDGTSVSGTRKIKANVPALGNVQFTYPRGKKFGTGAFIKPNGAGSDVDVDYD